MSLSTSAEQREHNQVVWMRSFFMSAACPFKMLCCAILGEEISGSEGSGSEEMDEGDEEGEAREGRRRKRGKE